MFKKKEGGLDSRKRIIILGLLIIFIFALGTIGFSFTKQVSLQEGFIITLEILSFTYNGETEGFAKIIKVFLSLFGVIFVWLALWESFDVMLESKFINNFGEANIMNQIKRLKNHYIICGGGRVGLHIAELLTKQEKPYVVIEKDEFNINQLRKKGHLVYEGDSLEEETLKNVNVNKAKALMAVLPESEKNILIILTVKELNKKLKIFARSHKDEYIKKMKKAGADIVVTPEISCAEELVNLIKK